MARDSDFARLRLVNVLAMAANRVPESPPVNLNQLYQVANLHSVLNHLIRLGFSGHWNDAL